MTQKPLWPLAEGKAHVDDTAEALVLIRIPLHPWRSSADRTMHARGHTTRLQFGLIGQIRIKEAA
jgi:hypothetical protein